MALHLVPDAVAILTEAATFDEAGVAGGSERGASAPASSRPTQVIE